MSLLKRTGTAIDDVTWDATELATKAELDAVKNTADSAERTADTANGVANAALPKKGGTMTGAINMNDKQVKNVGTPTDVNDAVTKKYVDDALSGVQPVGDYVNKSGDTMTGNLNMGNHQINNVNTMTVSNVIVKGTADSQVSIKTTGDASRSEIDLNDASDNPVVIKGVDTPADDMDAANKSYVDAVDAKVTAANAEITGVKNTVNGVVDGSVELPYLPLGGGTITGKLVVQTPTNNNEAATKAYVDSSCDEIIRLPIIPLNDISISQATCVKHHKLIFLNIVFSKASQTNIGTNFNYNLFRIQSDEEIEPFSFVMTSLGDAISVSGAIANYNVMYEWVCHINSDGTVVLDSCAAATDFERNIAGEPANHTLVLTQMFSVAKWY